MRECSIAPNEVAFANAIHACGRAGEFTEALGLLDLMRAENNPPPNVVCYTAALGACERAGQWQSVLDLLDEMRSAGVPPNVVTWSLAIRACADARQWRDVLAIYAELLSNSGGSDNDGAGHGGHGGHGGSSGGGGGSGIEAASDEVLEHVMRAYDAIGDRAAAAEIAVEIENRHGHGQTGMTSGEEAEVEAAGAAEVFIR